MSPIARVCAWAWPLVAVAPAWAAPTDVRAIWVERPSAVGEQDARDAFAEAARAEGLATPSPARLAERGPSRALDDLRRGQALVDELKYTEALRHLDAAATAAALAGAAGLSAQDLGDLFLYRALATQKAGADGATRAWDDFVRAAVLAPERVLDPGRFAPPVVDAFRRAVAEVAARARGVLVVRAPASARVLLDGRAPVPGPAVFPALPFGEHFLRVEEAGRADWSSTVAVAAPTVEIDVPVRPVSSLQDEDAAALARRDAAGHALVGELRVEGAEPFVRLCLITSAGRRLDETMVPARRDALARAVARLVAVARTSSPPAPVAAARAAEDTPAPAWRRPWVWGAAAALAAAGVAVFAVTRSGGDRDSFSASIDPRTLPP